MSGSFESVQWNACVHRLDLGLYFTQKRFLGSRVRTHVHSKGRVPSTGASEEGGTCYTASGRTASPAHFQMSYLGPHRCSVITLSAVWLVQVRTTGLF